MANIPVQVIISAVDNASKTLKGVAHEMSGLGDEFKRGGLMATGFLASLGYAGTQMLKMAGDVEQNRIAFETMTGSADEAQKMLKRVSDFAIATPFELPQVVEAAKQLMAMGASTEDVIPELKMLGDVAAGLGVPLERLILNFGQVRTQGVLTGRELRDFSIAGVPLIDELANSLGVAKDQIADMVSEGKIGFPEVRKAFENMTSEGGRFNNLMEKQAKSLQGIWSNIKDSMTRAITEIAGVSVEGEIRAGSFFDIAKKGSEGLLVALDKIGPSLIKMADWFSQNKVLVAGLAGAIGGLAIVAIGGLLATISGGLGVLAAFIAVGAGIGIMIANIVQGFQKAKESIDIFWIPAFEFAKQAVTDMVTNVTEWFNNLVISIGELLQKMTLENIVYWFSYAAGFIIATVSNFVVNTIEWFKQLPAKAGELFTQMKDRIVEIFTAVWSWISTEVPTWPDKLWGFLKSIPDKIGEIFSAMVRVIKDKLFGGGESAWGKIEDFRNKVVGAFDSIRDAISGAISKLKEGFKAGLSGGGGLPHFQSGGVVPGPIGMPRLGVVHGGETILPVGGGRPAVAAVGNNGSQVSLSVSIGMYAGTAIEKRNIAMELWEELGRLARSENKNPQELLGF